MSEETLDSWKDASTGTNWRVVERDGSVYAEEQDGLGGWWATDARANVVAKRLAQVLAGGKGKA